MRVSIAGICRGSGKIFLALQIRNIDTQNTLSVTNASARSGAPIPCSLYEYNADTSFFNYIVVLPQFSCVQKLHIGEFDRLLNEIDHKDLAISPYIAKWYSRISYRVKRNLTNIIRDYDKGRNCKEPVYEFIKCIPDKENNILTIRIALSSQYQGEVRLEVIDYNHNRLLVDPVLLGDRSVSIDNLLSDNIRTLLYSVRLPKKGAPFTFVLYENENQIPGFGAIDSVQYKDISLEGNVVYNNAAADLSYHDWFMNHKATSQILKMQRQTILLEMPKFSIIVPLYETPIPLFNEMVSSVIAQSYENWELILVNASRNNELLYKVVCDCCAKDSRIKQIVLKSNEGITLNTNAGIDGATGDFVSFFDHDDVIEPDILFEYAHAINEHPDVDLLYCDEDHLTPDNRRIMPYFKSDFSIDLERCNNYVCHMLTVRRSLLNRLPRPTKDFDGAQDHNMTLMVAEHARYIHHVPKILYHWRMSENSTASDPNSKPYAFDAGERAVRAHLDRLGIKARVEKENRPFTFRVIYEPPQPHPLVSILIPSKDNTSLLKECINSILTTTSYDNYEIIIIDNNSNEKDTLHYYQTITKAYSCITIVEGPKEFNFSKLVNIGAKRAQGDYFVLLNNDTRVITKDWLEQLVGLCSRPEVGIAGVRLWYPDDTIQHAGIRVFIGANHDHFTNRVAEHLNNHLPKSNLGYYALSDCQMNLSAVTGACMMLRREVFMQLGGMNESLAVVYNDVDLCLMARKAGYLIVYTPYVNLYHYEMFSRGADSESHIKRLRHTKEACYMFEKWSDDYVNGDPYYNKNLAEHFPYYSL